MHDSAQGHVLQLVEVPPSPVPSPPNDSAGLWRFQERQSWRFRDLVLLAGIATRPPRGCWWMGAQSLVVADEMRHLQSYLGPLDHLIGAVVHLVTVDY
jgi:hypothetical protein